MEYLLAAVNLHPGNLSPASMSSCRSPCIIRGGGCRTVRCATTKDAILYALQHEEMFNSDEVIQWESGKTINSIAAAQGIRIRRRCHPEGSKAVPRNILEKIVWDKELEVFQRKSKKPLGNVMESNKHAPPARDFIGALTAAYARNGVPALIAEVMKASPNQGMLRENFNPVEIAQSYQENGVACLSILTDEKHFKGSFQNLETIRDSGLKCPLLCKDFIIDIWQIYYARSKGADAIHLIAAVLPDLDMKYMVRVCKCLGMAALIEVHDERELHRILKIDGVDLIGINNRSLETSEVDTSNTRMLLEKYGDIIRDKGILVVGESSLLTSDNAAYVQTAGITAVLVEEGLFNEEDPGQAIAGLFSKKLSH